MESSNQVENLLKRESERQQDILKKKTEKKLTSAENEQYSYFNTVFEKKHQEINLMLKNAPTLTKDDLIIEFDKMSKELNLLKKFTTDSLIFLRGYDVRICSGHLQDLEIQIKKAEETLLPKKKFGFKNKKTPKITPDTTDGDTIDGTIIKKSIAFKEHFFGFRNRNDTKLTLNSDSLFKKDISLFNLTNCVVFLQGTPSTVHMSSLKHCLVFCGPVCTSIFAENCVECNFVIACQQLRLHSSFKLVIYLHVTSKAIVEDCKEIQVAPYNYKYSNIVSDFEKAGLDININHWDSLDDFNWLVADKQSPNWSILEEKDRISEWEEYII